MSIIQRADEDELNDATDAQLFAQLGLNDTGALYQRGYEVDTDHDIPTGAGNSIDRKTVYIDRTLYDEVMDGGFGATGLEPRQIIRLWCDHEHTEKALADGDNGVDFYLQCHARALRQEHRGVWHILGPGKVKNYEAVIWPGLERAYHNPKIVKVPKDLWCGPLSDESTERDLDILDILQRLGVVDASKHSKREAYYGFGAHSCGTCRFFSPDVLSQQDGQLAMCKVVSGLVRKNRGSDYWKPIEKRS
jgi:hypothetical protein